MIISNTKNIWVKTVYFLKMKYSFKLILVILIFSSSILFLLGSNNCSRLAVTESNRFLELLSLLPATAKKSGGFALIDYDLIRKANGLSINISDNQSKNRDDFLNILLNKLANNNLIGGSALAYSSFYSGWDRYTFESPIKESNIGYSLVDIDAEINNIKVRPNLDLSPDNKFNLVPDLMVSGIGRFDPLTTQNALKNRNEWPFWAKDSYAIENYRNINIYSWGDANEKHMNDKLNPPHLDPIGRAMPLALSNKFLFVSSSVQNVKSMIDSSMNKSQSLTDIPEYNLLAKGLSELGPCFAALIGDESLVNGYWINYKYYPGPLLNKFITFGAGYGKDEIGEYIALVLVFESSANAKENVPLLKQRILTTFTDSEGRVLSFSDIIYKSEVKTEGNVLLAKLYTKDQNFWHVWFEEQYPLVLHNP